MPPPLFPKFVEEEDFVQPVVAYSTLEAQREYLKAGYALTQHYWHLVLTQRVQ